MSCSTCLRRQKACDERRPRCSPCKLSHLRCVFDGPPITLQFHNQYLNSVSKESGNPPQTQRVCQHPRSDKSSPQFLQSDGLNQVEEAGVVSEDAQNLASTLSADFPWPDDFYQPFNLNAGSLHDFNFLQDVDLEMFPGLEQSIGLPTVQNHDASSLDCRSTGTPLRQSNEPPSKKSKTRGLPNHIIGQYFARKLAGRYSFKSADWTFYTYFFHRFTTSHPWVLSSISAWTSAHLSYSEKSPDLEDSLAYYSESMDHLRKLYAHTWDSMEAAMSTQDARTRDVALSEASDDDIDALFVGIFFLALFDLMAARPTQLRKILRFIAYVLHVPNIKVNLRGVRSRVATWFCIIDVKASALQSGDGAVLDAIGGEQGLLKALNSSYSTLQQVYSVTYPEEERKGDEMQLPLLQRMLSLATSLHDITNIKNKGREPTEVERIRKILDLQREAIVPIEKCLDYQGRSRSTSLVLVALYNAIEILFSRHLYPTAPRYSTSAAATKIVQVAQRLNLVTSKQEWPRSSPPATKIWPLPLVVAAIEVEDPIYREWALDRLRAYEQGAGDHYGFARKFVEKVCEDEDRTGRRVDLELLLLEIKDGLVI